MYLRLGSKEAGAQEMLMIAEGTRNASTKACSCQSRSRDKAIQQDRTHLDNCSALVGETEAPVSPMGAKDRGASTEWCQKGTSTAHRFSCLTFLPVPSAQPQLRLDEKRDLSLPF